jgi:hypothetical protein
MNHDWDIIVCGGGTAGAVAGIAAAREGAKTLIVEQFGALGGTQTQGWVTPMMPNFIGTTQLCQGLDAEIRRRHAAIHPGPPEEHNAQSWYNPHIVTMILDGLAEEHGTSLLFHSNVISVTKSADGWIVTVANKSGLTDHACKIVIDATGDADAVRLAGGELFSGDDEGRHQPMTLRFTIANVDFAAVAADLATLGINTKPPLLYCGFAEATDSPLGDRVRQALADGVLEEGDLGYFQFFGILGRPRELAFNCPRLLGFDGASAEDLSRAQILGRKKIHRIHQFLTRYMPGFSDSYVGTIAPMVGVRESRRIVGEYVLTEEDCLSARKFEDPVARCNYPVDVHNPSGPGVVLKKIPAGDYYEIPYRCLIPKNLPNFLVAGRCLSATFNAQSSARIQPVCRAMGEAAGIAGALCVVRNVIPTALAYPELLERLDCREIFAPR